MPFEKGDPRINRKGRPIGSKNKLREKIITLVESEIDEMLACIHEMKPKDRVDVLLQLLEFALPKYGRIDSTDEEVVPPVISFRLNNHTDIEIE